MSQNPPPPRLSGRVSSLPQVILLPPTPKVQIVGNLFLQTTFPSLTATCVLPPSTRNHKGACACEDCTPVYFREGGNECLGLCRGHSAVLLGALRTGQERPKKLVQALCLLILITSGSHLAGPLSQPQGETG